MATTAHLAQYVRQAERRLLREQRTIVEELARLRMDAGISQTALGRAAGVAQSYICQIEAGQRVPEPEVLVRLGAVLGLDIGLRAFPGTGPRLRDHIQTAIHEAMLTVAHRSWLRRLEVRLPRPIGGSIDAVLHDPARRQAVADEVQSELRRFEQQLRWNDAKAEALVPILPPGTEVYRLLVLRSTVVNRQLVAANAEVFAAAFPARAEDAYAALTDDRTRWPGDVLLWAAVDHGRARILPGPPRGIRVGR